MQPDMHLRASGQVIKACGHVGGQAPQGECTGNASSWTSRRTSSLKGECTGNKLADMQLDRHLKASGQETKVCGQAS